VNDTFISGLRQTIVRCTIGGAIVFAIAPALLRVRWDHQPFLGLGHAMIGGLIGAILGAVCGFIGHAMTQGIPAPTRLQRLVAQAIASFGTGLLLWGVLSGLTSARVPVNTFLLTLTLAFGLWFGRYSVFPIYYLWRRHPRQPQRPDGPPPGHPEQLD
jgi:hypothetical protein